MLHGFHHTDVVELDDASTSDDYNQSGSNTTFSSSSLSVPTIPSVSSTDSERSSNNKIIREPVKITKLRDLGLRDNRSIVTTSFTWLIDNWNELTDHSQTAGQVQSPRTNIEGYSWRFVLNLNQQNIGLYVRARPLACIEWPTSCEMSLIISNSEPEADASRQEEPNADAAPAAHHCSYSRDLQNQILSYTPVYCGYESFVEISELQTKNMLARDGKVNITAKLKLFKR